MHGLTLHIHRAGQSMVAVQAWCDCGWRGETYLHPGESTAKRQATRDFDFHVVEADYVCIPFSVWHANHATCERRATTGSKPQG